MATRNIAGDFQDAKNTAFWLHSIFNFQDMFYFNFLNFRRHGTFFKAIGRPMFLSCGGKDMSI